MNDLDIFLKAKAADFTDIMARLGPPPKIVNIHIGNSSNSEMYVFLAENLPKAVRLLTSFGTRIIDLD